MNDFPFSQTSYMFYLRSFFRYHIKGSYHYQKARMRMRRKDTPVVIYTMAKVGSMSFYRSLQAQLQAAVFHVHTLQESKIREAYQACREKGWWPDSKNPGALIYRQKILQQQPLKIISLVREPISRNISAFFEVFRFYTGQGALSYKGTVGDLQEMFLTKLDQDFPLRWLEEELQTCLGIDVYAQPFPHHQKYQYYQHDKLELLLLRTDLPHSEQESLVQSFLNIPDFQLRNHNVGSEKEYAALYSAFKQEVHLPEQYLAHMLESKYCQHFYSDEEIEGMYKKWRKTHP